MPKYRQMKNTCGLSSLLMVLQPETRGLAPFFDDAWRQLKPLFHLKGLKRKEFRWAVVLQYLLFKLTGQNPLRAAMADFPDLQEIYEVYVPVMQFTLRQGLAGIVKKFGADTIVPLFDRYQRTGYLFEELVYSRLFEMKDDPELKLLARLFGYRFVPWAGGPPEQWDGTGAMYFTADEMKGYRAGQPDPVFEEKADFLTKQVYAGHPVLCGTGHHWIAVKDAREFDGKYFLTVHDPDSGKALRVPLDRLGERERFYAFQPVREEQASTAGKADSPHLHLARAVIAEHVPVELERPTEIAIHDALAEVDRVTEAFETTSAAGEPREAGAAAVAGAAAETGPTGPTPAGPAPGSEAWRRLPIMERVCRRVRAAFSDYVHFDYSRLDDPPDQRD